MNRTIVLPETRDDRVLRAADRIAEKGCARIILLGEPDAIAGQAKACEANVSAAEIVNPLEDEKRDAYVETLYERRKPKGMSLDEVEDLLRSNVYYGAMMLEDGRCDGMVAGSVCPTKQTVRAALYSVGMREGCRTVSACSIMNTIVPELGVHGSLVFADTGVVPEPTPERLADIAVAAADACAVLLDVEPVVAMLSFSTKGSATSPAVEKVIEATRIARQRRPELKLDGELQLDAAIVPDVASRKAEGSPVAGRANTLIFPDLSSGNIGYKLVERLGRASALGPLLLGLAKPVNDLSRGCSVDDIVEISAITAVQSQADIG